MKIGIFTFHWSPNHGAVLQAWCLQEYLKGLGHEVDIIHYKPSVLDFSWLRIAVHPRRWMTLKHQLASHRKDAVLAPFRAAHLRMTPRFRSLQEAGPFLDRYDVLVSGSDQVLNPSFTLGGEGGKPSPAYWLGAGRSDARRVGYAVSFGCESYPEAAASLAREWVRNFDAVGTRERTGMQILRRLGYEGPARMVPDPTLLLGADLFRRLGITVPIVKASYVCVYMLRREIRLEGEVRYLDERHRPLSMEAWLETLAAASGLVTNSYHGMLVAILAHVPFAVLLETGEGSGMNDRFCTLLDRLGVSDRVAATPAEAMEVLRRPLRFDLLDAAVAGYAREGKDFLAEACR